jgi:hypothetical protein
MTTNFKKTNIFLFSIVSVLSAVSSLFFVLSARKNSDFFLSQEMGKIDASFIIIFIFFLVVLFFSLNKSQGFYFIAKAAIIVFLPSELILFYAFFYDSYYYGKYTLFFLDPMYFSHPLRLLSSLYLFFAGFTFLFRYKNYRYLSDLFYEFKNKKESDKKKKSVFIDFKKQNILAPAVLLLVLATNIFFGLSHLSEFAAVDEPLWTQNRIIKFWSNIKDREFYKTMISDKPGITVAIISGIGLNWVNPKEYKDTEQDGVGIENFKDVREMNFAMRLPIFLFNCLMLILFYVFLKKLFGNQVSLFSVILIGLSPILLGISTIINPDSLLWTFVPLSIICFLIYLRNEENKYLYLSGFFLGLAILTKYVANILYVYFFGLLFLEYVFRKSSETDFYTYFKKAFADYLIMVFISLFTFFLFLPAAWVKISNVFSGTILSPAFIQIWKVSVSVMLVIAVDTFFWKNHILSVPLKYISKYKAAIIYAVSLIFIVATSITVFNTWFGMKLFDIELILASPKTSHTAHNMLGLFLTNFYSLLFGISPIAFLALIYATASNFFKRKINNDVACVSYFLFFIMLYYAASTASFVSATVRYQIVLYPIALILAAIGFNEIINKFNFRKKIFFACGVVILFISSLYSLNFIKPFYFGYASDLLPSKYVLNLKDMGDGSYEAAEYLNQKDNAKNLNIWSDKRGVCAFFIGNCMSGFYFDENQKIDYFVVSSGRETRTSKMTVSRINLRYKVGELYAIEDCEFKLEIGGRPNNYVKIIRAEALSARK